jgi:hypothetical protein
VRRWVVWSTAGELAGFVAPAVVGVCTVSWSPWAGVPALVAAGFLEGLLLGASQAAALSLELTQLRRRRFALNTGCAAAFGYVMGLAPSSWGAVLLLLPTWAVAAVGAVMGVALLSSIGFAQWLELRHQRAGVLWWVAGTALGWLAGLAALRTCAHIGNEGSRRLRGRRAYAIARSPLVPELCSLTAVPHLVAHNPGRPACSGRYARLITRLLSLPGASSHSRFSPSGTLEPRRYPCDQRNRLFDRRPDGFYSARRVDRPPAGAGRSVDGRDLIARSALTLRANHRRRHGEGPATCGQQACEVVFPSRRPCSDTGPMAPPRGTVGS